MLMLGKQVDRHAGHRHHADHGDDEAHHDDEVRDSEARSLTFTRCLPLRLASVANLLSLRLHHLSGLVRAEVAHDHSVTLLQPRQHLDAIRVFQPGLDFARLHAVLLIDHQHRGLAVLLLHRLDRHGQRIRMLLGLQRDVGIHSRLQFVVSLGTSISTCMVRVVRSSASVKRVTLPVKCSPVACTVTSAGCPMRTVAASDSGTGMRSRRTFTCASFTTGAELLLDVPACTSAPVSA